MVVIGLLLRYLLTASSLIASLPDTPGDPARGRVTILILDFLRGMYAKYPHEEELNENRSGRGMKERNK
jgi:hypothetical protein